MTYEEAMAAARQADAAGRTGDARRLLETAETLRAQPVPETGPWTKYGQPAQQPAAGPWTKYAQGAAAQPSSPAGNQRQPNIFDQFDEPAAPAAPKGNIFDQFDEPAAASTPGGNFFDQFDPPVSAPAAGGFIEVEIPDGRILEFPVGTSEDVMRGAIDTLLGSNSPKPAPLDAATGQALPMPITPPAYYDGTVAPPPAATAPAQEDPVDSWLLDVAASGAKGVRDGLTAIPDAAIHAVNNAPRLLNAPKMIPGMEDAYGDVGTITDFGAALDSWMAGSDFAVPEGTRTAPVTLQDVTNGFGALDYQPQTGAGRFADRVGNEIGASLLPAGAALRFGDAVVSNPAAHEGVRRLVEPFVRNPRAAMGRELAGATAAGAGAATANAMHDAATGGDGGTWWTDLLGGIGGLGVAGAAEGVARSVADIGRHVTNSPRFQQQIAGEAVTDRLIDNSTTMQAERFAGRPLDAEVLAQRLDRPTALEDLVPEYRAGTADRSGDSGIRSLAYNTEALAPGAANVRREQNMSAVGDYIRGLLPDGNAPTFLETVRDAAGNIIETARSAAGAARSHFDDAMDAARARMQPIDRGQAIRDDMTAVYDQRRAEYRGAYDARDAAMANDRIDAGAPYRALAMTSAGT